MDDPFRFPGGARRVEDVEQILGIHLFRLAPRRDVGAHELVIPVIAIRLECDVRANAAPHDDDVLDGRCALERFVRHLLQRHRLSAAEAAVGRDQHFRGGVVDAIAQGHGAEPAEDDAVDRADARAREHRHGELGDHRQVDRDAVAAPHAQTAQHAREAVHFAEQIPVGQRAPIAGLAFPDERRLVAARRPDVAIEAVDARVDRAADEPFCVRRLPVEHAAPRRRPLELPRERGPERLRIALGLFVDARVGRDRARFELCGRFEDAPLIQQRIDIDGIGHDADYPRDVKP